MKDPKTIPAELEVMARDLKRNWKTEPRILTLTSYRLVTADITYHLPDHPSLVQSFIFQTLDLAPNFPEVRKFIDFWRRNIEGKLHSVIISPAEVIGRADFTHGSYIN